MRINRETEIERAVAYSRATASLEGIRETEYSKNLNSELLAGKITIEEAIRKTREKYGLEQQP